MGFRFTNDHIEFFLSDRFAEIDASFERIQKKYGDSLRIQTALRSEFPDIPVEYIRAAMAQIALQAKSALRLNLHPGSLLTETALEQASSKHSAAVHAGFFRRHERVLELCGGVGSDTAAISALADFVTVVEADPLVAAMLRYNLSRLGRTNVRVVDATAEDFLGKENPANFTSIFADPSRRASGKRVIDGEYYSPPLGFLKEISLSTPMAVKVAPAFKPTDKHWSKLYVAVRDECKELILFYGFDVPETSIVEAVTGKHWAPRLQREAIRPVNPAFIIEPHNAVIASGHVKEYLAERNAVPVHERIAYGLADTLPHPCVWHRSYRIIDAFPFNKNRLAKAMRSLAWGKETEIKKRGFPLLPEQIAKLLDLPASGRAGVIILTRKETEHVVFLCERAD